MTKAYITTALFATRMHINRPALPFFIMSNKFTLSDFFIYPPSHDSVVLVSWVDSAKIPPLVEEISI